MSLMDKAKAALHEYKETRRQEAVENKARVKEYNETYKKALHDERMASVKIRARHEIVREASTPRARPVSALDMLGGMASRTDIGQLGTIGGGSSGHSSLGFLGGVPAYKKKHHHKKKHSPGKTITLHLK